VGSATGDIKWRRFEWIPLIPGSLSLGVFVLARARAQRSTARTAKSQLIREHATFFNDLDRQRQDTGERRATTSLKSKTERLITRTSISLTHFTFFRH